MPTLHSIAVLSVLCNNNCDIVIVCGVEEIWRDPVNRTLGTSDTRSHELYIFYIVDFIASLQKTLYAKAW